MRKFLFLLLFAALLTLPACSGNTVSTTVPSSTAAPVVVGSKIDTEGGLLAQIIIQMLNAGGIKTVDKSQLGPTQIVRQALLSGDIDVYPEYTGNGALFFPNVDPSVWKNAQKGYDEVKSLDKSTNNIIWLQPAPANNTWAIAVTKKLADANNLKSLTDLAAYINNGGDFKLAASDEFVTSPVALPAFKLAYGFNLRPDQLVTFSGGNTAQTEKAAADGTDGVNAAMAYGTDGTLAAFNLVVMNDPKGVQPVYEPAPTVRGVVYDRYPQMSTILDPVFQSLGLTTLQTLNGRIVVNGEQSAAVAGDYLKSKGFLK